MSSLLLIIFKNTLVIQVGLFLCFAVFRYIGICILRILLVISVSQMDGREMFSHTQEK